LQEVIVLNYRHIKIVIIS